MAHCCVEMLACCRYSLKPPVSVRVGNVHPGIVGRMRMRVVGRDELRTEADNLRHDAIDLPSAIFRQKIGG